MNEEKLFKRIIFRMNSRKNLENKEKSLKTHKYSY